MPIYEFKCLKCNECFEILLISQDEEGALRCPKCKATELERVLSCTNYAMTGGSGGNTGVTSKTRNCPSGSCTTYEIPGPNG